MADTISVRFDKEMQKDLSTIEKKWSADRSEVIRRLLTNAIKEWKINYAIEELTLHKISLGKAAEIADISIWEMLEITKKNKVDWIGMSAEDVEKDLNTALILSKKIK